jgi:hypothetical protein
MGEFVGNLLVGVGVIVLLVGWFWLIALGFTVSPLWGFGVFIPVVALIFVVTYWEDVQRPFFVHVAGFVVMFIGRALLKASGVT